MRLDVYVHAGSDGTAELLHQVLTKLTHMETTIMPTLDELKAKADATLAQVTADTNLDNAVATVVNNQNATIADLKAQLAAAGTDPAKLQALSDTMDAILATDTSNAAIVSAAVTAGTPVTAPSS